MVNHFTNDTLFEFALDLVQAFDLRASSELLDIKQSRHPIIDRAFSDPESDKKHVPPHILEDLISGDERLLIKMFLAFIRKGKTQQASGLY